MWLLGKVQVLAQLKMINEKCLTTANEKKKLNKKQSTFISMAHTYQGLTLTITQQQERLMVKEAEKC